MKPSVKPLCVVLLISLFNWLNSRDAYCAGKTVKSGIMQRAFIDKNGKLVVTPSANSQPTDFDFLAGEHLVMHERLKARLAGSPEWLSFEGRHNLEFLLEGQGNLEQHFMQDNEGKPIQGVALRLFDPITRLWSIYWSDSRNCTLDIPVVGSFENGLGYFYARDRFQGRPIIIQFKWDATDPHRPVWSQAFSADQGHTWEWNWFMYFRKTADILPQAVAEDSIRVIELRNYVMKPGMRETFIPFFEKNFVTSQDTLQGHILGRYRVKDKDDNFCWIRGFKDMQTRGVFLPAFYHGPVWHSNRKEANGMLANNDNVYLLKPLAIEGDSLVGGHAVPPGILAPQKGITVVQLFVANSKLHHLVKLCSGDYISRMRSAGYGRFSFWESELQVNDFPQLPVFQDRNLLVLISFFRSEQEFRAAEQKLRAGLSEDQKADFDDTITLQGAWILYPTDKSLGK